jgi:hypothetical protein
MKNYKRDIADLKAKVTELESKLQALAAGTLMGVTSLAEAVLTVDAKQKFGADLDRAIAFGGNTNVLWGDQHV